MVVRKIGLAARCAGGVVSAIASLRALERRQGGRRPHPLRWLRSASLDRRLGPYSAIGDYRPPD